MKQVEELLKPRYKVIADYPSNIFPIGHILYCHKWPEGSDKVIEYLDKYPHLFKRLEWWEERKEDEMSEYVKAIRGYQSQIIQNHIYKATTFKDEYVYISGIGYHLMMFAPATQAEYESFINQNK